jgi:hypothetical protein
MVSLVQNAIPQPMGVLSRVQAGVKEERIETGSNRIGETLHCSSSITVHTYSSGIYKCICIHMHMHMQCRAHVASEGC